MTVAGRLRRAVARSLPPVVREPLQRVHYRRLVRRFPLQDLPDLELCRPFLRPGDLAVDVGANVGVYTRFLSEWVGPGGRVVSVEPVPGTYGILCANLRSLGWTNVDPVAAALSDREGAAAMHLPESAAGPDIYLAHVVEADRAGPRDVRVQTTTLDRLVAERAPTFVKIDVEGHERSVLAGAAKTLRRRDVTWLIEVNGDPDVHGSDEAAVFSTMRDVGYRAWIRDGGRWAERKPGRRAVNYLFRREAP